MTVSPVFNFVLVYEDWAAGIRAKEMSDRLAARLQPECPVGNEAWNFALLNEPEWRDLAAADARRADMVIISVRTASALPPQVRSWLGEWLPTRTGERSALVVLLDSPEADRQAEHIRLREELQQLAGNSLIDFFCGHPPTASGREKVVPLSGFGRGVEFTDAV